MRGYYDGWTENELNHGIRELEKLGEKGELTATQSEALFAMQMARAKIHGSLGRSGGRSGLW
jgi:hypothetical protein